MTISECMRKLEEISKCGIKKGNEREFKQVSNELYSSNETESLGE